MKGASQNLKLTARETRTRLICNFICAWLDDDKETQTNYADNLRALYWLMVPDPAERCVDFHWGGDPASDLEANRQLVMRRIKYITRLDADLEEAFVFALPDGPRAKLIQLLAARYFLLAVPIPQHDGPGAAQLARLLTEFGQMVEASAPLLADGEVNSKDKQCDLEKGLEETDDVLAAVIEYRNSLVAALDAKQLEAVA